MGNVLAAARCFEKTLIGKQVLKKRELLPGCKHPESTLFLFHMAQGLFIFHSCRGISLPPEISIEESNVKMKDIFYENLFNDEPSNELSYRLLLGKFNFVYYSDKNNTINILSKREIFADDENIDKNIIKDEKIIIRIKTI
jgi:hypothetical protein